MFLFCIRNYPKCPRILRVYITSLFLLKFASTFIGKNTCIIRKWFDTPDIFFRFICLYVRFISYPAENRSTINDNKKKRKCILGNSQIKDIWSVLYFIFYFIIYVYFQLGLYLRLQLKNKPTVWILSMFFSPYKATENSIDYRCFVSRKLAQEAIRREARRLYKYSDIIQEAEDKII